MCWVGGRRGVGGDAEAWTQGHGRRRSRWAANGGATARKKCVPENWQDTVSYFCSQGMGFSPMSAACVDTRGERVRSAAEEGRTEAGEGVGGRRRPLHGRSRTAANLKLDGIGANASLLQFLLRERAVGDCAAGMPVGERSKHNNIRASSGSRPPSLPHPRCQCRGHGRCCCRATCRDRRPWGGGREGGAGCETKARRGECAGHAALLQQGKHPSVW